MAKEQSNQSHVPNRVWESREKRSLLPFAVDDYEQSRKHLRQTKPSAPYWCRSIGTL